MLRFGAFLVQAAMDPGTAALSPARAMLAGMKPILQEQDALQRASMLAIRQLTYYVLELGRSLVGITLPSRMRSHKPGNDAPFGVTRGFDPRVHLSQKRWTAMSSSVMNVCFYGAAGMADVIWLWLLNDASTSSATALTSGVSIGAGMCEAYR